MPHLPHTHTHTHTHTHPPRSRTPRPHHSAQLLPPQNLLTFIYQGSLTIDDILRELLSWDLLADMHRAKQPHDGGGGGSSGGGGGRGGRPGNSYASVDEYRETWASVGIREAQVMKESHSKSKSSNSTRTSAHAHTPTRTRARAGASVERGGNAGCRRPRLPPRTIRVSRQRCPDFSSGTHNQHTFIA